MQHKCQCGQLPLFPLIQPTLPLNPRTTCFIPAPLTNTNHTDPINSKLSPTTTCFTPPIATLPEKEPEPDQQEPEPDQQEHEQEQQEPEPNQHKTKSLRDIELMHAEFDSLYARVKHSINFKK